MATRFDPSATSLLRAQFIRDMRARFSSVIDDVWELVVVQDVFGLEGGAPFAFKTNAERQAWRFQTNDKKLEQFNAWLKEKVDKKILSTDAKGQPWTGKYVESAYKKGALRAYTDSRGKGLNKLGDFFKGTQSEFLRAAFNQPEQLSKVRLLATRAFEELKGVTGTMATNMNRILANGLVKGENPRQIARTMAKSIRGLTKTRALTIARTEIIHAHAEGQLDSFEALGIDEVGVYAEWSTAGDDKVCSQCEALEGAIMTVDEARGLIPRHPNCRCAWIPATDVNTRTRRKRMLAKVRASVGTKSKSTWAGKRLIPPKRKKPPMRGRKRRK